MPNDHIKAYQEKVTAALVLMDQAKTEFEAATTAEINQLQAQIADLHSKMAQALAPA